MLKVISATLMIGGFIIVLGTAGSSDLGLLTFGQIVVRCIIGLGVMVGGYAIKRIAEFQKQHTTIIKRSDVNAQVCIHNRRI